jgi:2Fe-2S ferredoxin
MKTFRAITRSGREIDVEYDGSDNIMVALYDHFKGEPWGDCGGSCICATCHVEIVEGYPIEPNEEEEDQLVYTSSRTKNSRLGCQCDLDNVPDKSLVVKVPHID